VDYSDVVVVVVVEILESGRLEPAVRIQAVVRQQTRVWAQQEIDLLRRDPVADQKSLEQFGEKAALRG